MIMSSCVVVKEKMTGELELKEEEDEETKRRRMRERKVMYERERRERVRRICAGEDVPGIGEEEKKRILEVDDKRMQRHREAVRKVAAERSRMARELERRILEGEDVQGVGEEEKRRILEKKEKQKEKEEENEETRRRRRRREKGTAYNKERRERIRRVCAGENVHGVSEEERRKIIEQEERRKQKNRENSKKAYDERQRMERELKRRICAGEDVPGVGEEERLRIIEDEEKRKERHRLYTRKRYLEIREERRAYNKEYRKRRKETAEQREARLERQKFNNLLRRVKRTEEEKAELRRRNYFYRQARLAMMSEEEREAEKRRINEWHREWLRNLSEEKRRKHAEALKRASKKWQQKWKERDPERFKKNKTYNKELWERMSEDEKRRRLNQMKMYQQKRKLRRKLEGTMDDEEIERRLEELDKRLRDELGIGPPRPRGFFGKRGSECGDAHSDASCSTEKSTGPVDKLEVGQWSDHSFVNLNPTTLFEDSQADQMEQAESNFCDFDEDEGASMPSPPEATQLNTPSPSPRPHEQQEEPVTTSITPEIVKVTFSCEYCECPAFLTENDLKSHLQENHIKICWKCPSCKEVMISSKHFSEHFKAVHKKPSVSGSSLDTQTPQNLKAKGPTVAVPSAAHVVSQEKSNSRKYGDGFSSRAEYLCLRCPLKSVKNSKIITVFKDRGKLHSHVKNKHRKYYWPCEYCHLLKYSRQSLNVHLMLCRKKNKSC